MVIAIGLVLFVLHVICGCSGNDNTREPVKPRTNYCGTVEAVVSLVEEAVTHDTSRLIFGSTNGFLRFLAFFETRDGETLQQENVGGLWRVDKNTFTKVQNSIYFKTNGSRLYTIPVYHVFQVYFLSPDSIQYQDLDKPIVSALFSILSLIEDLSTQGLSLADIPKYAELQQELFRVYYDGSNLAETRYNQAREAYGTYTCGVECTNKMDVVFVLDGSGSTGQNDFKACLDFVSQLVGHYDLQDDKVQVGVIVYDDDIHSQIRLNQFNNTRDIQNAIGKVDYPGGFSYTGKAIKQSSALGFSKEFGSRPISTGVAHVMVVITEGRSYDDVHIPAWTARMAGIELFVVGVGNKINEKELQAMTDNPTKTYRLSHFNSLPQIVIPLYRKTCDAKIVVKEDDRVTLSILKGTMQHFKMLLLTDSTQTVTFSSEGTSFVIYGSFDFRNPSPFQYDYYWEANGGRYSFSTRLSFANQETKRAFTESFYVTVMNMTHNFTLSVEVKKSTTATVELAGTIKQLSSSDNVKMYQCSVTCPCAEAYVSWEMVGFDGSLPSIANVTTTSNRRSATLLLNTLQTNYQGEYRCIVRSPHVLGYESLSVELYKQCLNGGININPQNCLCTVEYTGSSCNKSTCTRNYYVGYSRKWTEGESVTSYLFAIAEDKGIIYVTSSDGLDKRVAFVNKGNPATIKLVKNDDYHIQVSSLRTVTLIGGSVSSGSAGAFEIMSTRNSNAFGSYHYLGISVASTYQYVYKVQPEGFITIVGTTPNTRVRIIAPQRLAHIKIYKNHNYSYQLPFGTFALEIHETLTVSSRKDLTGTEIISNFPLAVYSGHACGNVPQGVHFCDYMIEQIPPIHSLGKEYIVAAFAGRRHGAYIKIIGAYNTTSINIFCKNRRAETLIISATQIKEFSISHNDVCGIYASKPVMVAELSRGQGNDLRGDPAIVILKDTASFTTKVAFNSFSLDSYIQHFVNIIVDKIAFSEDRLTLDNLPLSSVKYDILWAPLLNGKEYVVVRVQRLRATFHEIECAGSQCQFGVVMYGFGPGSGYAYTTSMKDFSCTTSD